MITHHTSRACVSEAETVPGGTSSGVVGKQGIWCVSRPDRNPVVPGGGLAESLPIREITGFRCSARCGKLTYWCSGHAGECVFLGSGSIKHRGVSPALTGANRATKARALSALITGLAVPLLTSFGYEALLETIFGIQLT